MAVTACAQTLAPAQCTRQAGLVHKQALHGIKKRRDVLDTQTKQAKHAQHLAAKATSQAAAHSHAQAAQAQGDKRLVKQQAPKPDKAPMAKQQRPKNTANADGKANPARSPKPLTVQPSAEQRRANVAKAAEKEKIILARKDQAKARQAKRAAKSANKAAKDKAALEQAANGGG